MEIAGRWFPLPAFCGILLPLNNGGERGVDGLKNSTVIVTVVLCVLILTFLIFVIWQSRTGSPTIPTDVDLLEEQWAEENGTGGAGPGGSGSGSGGSGENGGAGGSVGTTDADGNIIPGSGGNGGGTGTSGGSSGGSVSPDQKPVKEEDMKPFKGKKADPYMRILASGVYTWDVVSSQQVDGEETDMPLILTASGKKLSIQMTYSDKLSMSVISDGQNTYAVLPFLKAYTDVPDSMAGDFKGLVIDPSKFEYVSTMEVASDGQTLICERYTSDTDRIYFYFSGDKLVKMELRGAGGTMKLKVNSITGQIDASLLSVPEGYKKRNLSFLFK